jgi:hypothetical protein
MSGYCGVCEYLIPSFRHRKASLTFETKRNSDGLEQAQQDLRRLDAARRGPIARSAHIGSQWEMRSPASLSAPALPSRSTSAPDVNSIRTDPDTKVKPVAQLADSRLVRIISTGGVRRFALEGAKSCFTQRSLDISHNSWVKSLLPPNAVSRHRDGRGADLCKTARLSCVGLRAVFLVASIFSAALPFAGQ